MHDTIMTLVAPAARQGGTADDPSGGVRLARGLDAPISRTRLGRGLNTPSGEVRLARGLDTPSGEVRLTRGHLHARRPRSCPRVRAFNATTPQDARQDLDTPGNRVPVLFHRLPGGGHPRHCVALCDEAGVSPVTLRRLLPGGGHPRRGPATPSNAFSVTTQGYAVTSGRRERSSPSLSTLCGHPRHCSTTPGTMTTSPMLFECTGTKRRHDCHCAAYRPPIDGTLEPARGGGRTTNHYAATLEAAPVQAQDAPRCLDWSRIR
jgi:hypothetical protein